MCKYVHAAVTAHAPVTFSTLLNTDLPAQCSWGRTIFYPETTAKLAVTSFYSGRAHPNGFELPRPEQCLRIWRHWWGPPFGWKQFLLGRGPFAWLSFHYSLHPQGIVSQECFYQYSDSLCCLTLESSFSGYAFEQKQDIDTNNKQTNKQKTQEYLGLFPFELSLK